MGALTAGGHWVMQAMYLLGMIGIAHGGYRISQGDTTAGKNAIAGGGIASAAPFLMNTMYSAGGVTGMVITLIDVCWPVIAAFMGVR